VSKSAEAQIEVEERRRARVETLEAYCAFMDCPVEWAKEPEPSVGTRLSGHAGAACFIVAMLGPKLDAIEGRLVRLEAASTGAPHVPPE